MSFQIGRSYGSYEIIDVLHSSREGVTYKVRNRLVNRLEAMKVRPGNGQNDQEEIELFLREIRVHASMMHPNIVTFYNAAELEGRLVMTSELVEGVTLAERLELGPLPWKDAIRYMAQVLSALAYAHERCVVHRDLNPSRIILTPDGPARLCGFSLAKGLWETHLTMVGAVVGSLKYISPEQVKGIERLDGRTDIYSAGAVLFEALVGKPPFDARSQFDLISAHVNAIPPAPSAMNRRVPPELDVLVLKALAKNPAERFQTATNFREALDALAAPPPEIAEPAQSVESMRQVPPKTAMKTAAEAAAAPSQSLAPAVVSDPTPGPAVAQAVAAPALETEKAPPAVFPEGVAETTPEPVMALPVDPTVEAEVEPARKTEVAGRPSYKEAVDMPTSAAVVPLAAVAEAIAEPVPEALMPPPSEASTAAVEPTLEAEIVAQAPAPSEPVAEPSPEMGVVKPATEAEIAAQAPAPPEPAAEPAPEAVVVEPAPEAEIAAQVPAPPEPVDAPAPEAVVVEPAPEAEIAAQAPAPSEPAAAPAREAAVVEAAPAAKIAAQAPAPPEPAPEAAVVEPASEAEIAAQAPAPPEPMAEPAPEAAIVESAPEVKIAAQAPAPPEPVAAPAPEASVLEAAPEAEIAVQSPDSPKRVAEFARVPEAATAPPSGASTAGVVEPLPEKAAAAPSATPPPLPPAPRAAPPPQPPSPARPGPQTLPERNAPPRLPADFPMSPAVFAPPSATPVPRELMLAALLLILVAIAAFIAFR